MRSYEAGCRMLLRCLCALMGRRVRKLCNGLDWEGLGGAEVMVDWLSTKKEGEWGEGKRMWVGSLHTCWHCCVLLLHTCCTLLPSSHRFFGVYYCYRCHICKWL